MEIFSQQPEDIKLEGKTRVTFDGEKEPTKDELPKISLTALTTACGLNKLQTYLAQKKYTRVFVKSWIYMEKINPKKSMLCILYALGTETPKTFYASRLKKKELRK
jgi:hypothetical protein